MVNSNCKLMEIINTILIVNPTYNRSLVANNEQSCFVRIVLYCMYVLYMYMYFVYVLYQRHVRIVLFSKHHLYINSDQSYAYKDSH